MATAFTGGGKYVPDDIRFQTLYRFSFKDFAKSSIDCLSTPAAPALAFTALKASYTSCFGMVNCFAALTGLLLFPVGLMVQQLDPTPSLRPHCRPSSLVRIGPPQGPASVLSPHGFRPLVLLP